MVFFLGARGLGAFGLFGGGASGNFEGLSNLASRALGSAFRASTALESPSGGAFWSSHAPAVPVFGTVGAQTAGKMGKRK